MKTNTSLDKLDEETKNKIIEEAKKNFQYYYETELPKKIEQYAKEEIDYRNSIKWIAFGFILATLLLVIILLIIKISLK